MDRSDQAAIEAAAEALLRLGDSQAVLATRLARVVAVVADEARRTPRLARALKGVMEPAPVDEHMPARKTARRAPGALDPFAAYAVDGEVGLRMQLEALTLDQLRDIVAEHGMDQDRLAMKWKQPGRVIDRIIERVASRSAKGSAFRAPAP